MQGIGIYFDDIYDRNGKYVRTTERKNIFVHTSGFLLNFILVDYFLTGVRQPLPLSHPTISDKPIAVTDPTLGQIFHAFGQGNASWDASPVEPQWFENKLVSEFHRRVPDSVNFIKFGEGTALSGDLSEIVDPRRFVGTQLVGRTEPDDWFNGREIKIISGTNAGQTRTILDFEQQTGRIIVTPNYPDLIDATSKYEITAFGITTPSNFIEIRTTIPFGLVSDEFNNKDYREHAIFGGENADLTDGGILLTKAHHPKRFKDEGFIFNRTYRIGYNF